MRFKELYKKARDKEPTLLDEDSMWSVIESNLEKPKRKRRFFWLWFLGGIIVFSLLVYANKSITSNNSISKNRSNSGIEEVANSNPEPVHSYSDRDEVKEYSNETTSVPENVVIPTSSTLPGKGSIEKDRTRNNLIIKSFDQHQDLGVNNNDFINTSALNIFAVDKENIPSAYVESDSKLNEKAIDQEDFSVLPQTNLLVEDLEVLPIRTSRIYSSKDLFTPELVFIRNHKSRRYELAFNVSYLSHTNSISTNLPDVQPWANRHDLSNSPLPSFEFSTLVRYRWRSGLGIGLGLKARQLSEWYEASVTQVETIQIQSDSAAYTTIDGVREYASGVLTGTSTQNIHYRTPIRRFYIDLPIALSYRKSIGYFDVDLDLAYNFNVSHRYYGRSFNEDLILLGQTEISESQLFRSNFVHSVNVGLAMNYHWSERISIGINANYWKQLSSSLSSTSLEEKYRGIGIGVNLVKRL